jgi:hypothetical protein
MNQLITVMLPQAQQRFFYTFSFTKKLSETTFTKLQPNPCL